MDRVVCGDVGFGKTEVAMRAALSPSGRQAGSDTGAHDPACQQHYENFRDRFADWPVRSRVLSRFRSPRRPKSILEGLRPARSTSSSAPTSCCSTKTRFKRSGWSSSTKNTASACATRKGQVPARGGRRTHADGHADPAHPEHGAGGMRELSMIATPPPTRVRSRLSSPVERRADPRGLSARNQARRPGVLRAQPRRRHRTACRQAGEPRARGDASRSATARCASASSNSVMLDFYHRRFNSCVCTTIIESGIDVPLPIPSLSTAPIASASRNCISCAVELEDRTTGLTRI